MAYSLLLLTIYIDIIVKICYYMYMIKKIEIGIAGRGLNKSSFSWIEGLATRLLIKISVLTRSDGSIRVMAEGEEQDLEVLAKKSIMEASSLRLKISLLHGVK